MSSYDYTEPVKSYLPSPSLEGDDLHRAKGCDPHVVTFWNAVCAFIDQHRNEVHPDHEIEYPSWGQWRSIGQHLAAGKKVEAIKLLRASTCVWEKKPLPTPAFVTNTAWKEFMVGNGTRQWDHHGGLSLSEAKSIIDTLETCPHWFGRDTNREFNPRHVTCADGGHVPEEPKPLQDSPAPSNLGAILREALERLEAPKEHSLWLNAYPDVGAACGHLTRGAADAAAHGNRIACINVTFKEGEGL